MSERTRKTLRDVILTAAMLAALVFVGGSFLYLLSKEHHQVKVIDCRSNPVKFSLITPAPSSGRYFLLAVPKSIPKRPPQYRGWMTLRQEGKVILDFPFSARSSMKSNWLDDRGVTGYVIVGEGKYRDFHLLPKYLHDGQSFEVTVSFSQPPPDGSSLWFSWTSKGRWGGKRVMINGRTVQAR